MAVVHFFPMFKGYRDILYRLANLNRAADATELVPLKKYMDRPAGLLSLVWTKERMVLMRRVFAHIPRRPTKMAMKHSTQTTRACLGKLA